MITLNNHRSGGSGVILKSTPNKSYILTNVHICILIQVGGIVTTDDGATYPVHSFKVYKRHDLCEITVLGNLHVNNKIAETQPKQYEEVTVAGHPALLPTMVTRGHLSNHMSIRLIVGAQKCDGDEEDQDALFCSMAGQKPQYRTFESQPTTATIMAGSSGSGVFNSRGEIVGLIFAGSEDLSYGFTVPYEYVHDFVAHIKQYPEQFPNEKADQNFFVSFFKMQDACIKEPKKCWGVVFQGIYNGN
jgi:S1-C subfamily serine protease